MWVQINKIVQFSWVDWCPYSMEIFKDTLFCGGSRGGWEFFYYPFAFSRENMFLSSCIHKLTTCKRVELLQFWLACMIQKNIWILTKGKTPLFQYRSDRFPLPWNTSFTEKDLKKKLITTVAFDFGGGGWIFPVTKWKLFLIADGNKQNQNCFSFTEQECKKAGILFSENLHNI